MQHYTTSNKGSNQQVSSTVKRFSGQQFLSKEKQKNHLKVRSKSRFVGDLFCDCCVFPSIGVWVTEKRSALRFYCISSEFWFLSPFRLKDYRREACHNCTHFLVFCVFMMSCRNFFFFSRFKFRFAELMSITQLKGGGSPVPTVGNFRFIVR